MTGVADDLFEADASQRKERASVPSVRVGGRLAEAIIWMIWSGGDEDHAHSSYVPPTVHTDCYLHWRCWIFFFEPYRAIDPTRCSREPTNRLAVDCLCNPRRPPLEYRKVDTDFQMGAQWQWGCGSRLAVQIAQVRPRPGGAAFSMNPPPCLLTRTPSIMTIIKVKQSIIDKVPYLRRAVYEKGRKYVRSVSLQDSNVACLHT